VSNSKSLEEKYKLILECRKSGLSDREWCFRKGIPQSTFYQWLKKLRDRACYNIPETQSRNSEISKVQKQDVVKLNIYPEKSNFENAPMIETGTRLCDKPAITIEFEGVKLSVENYTDPTLLAQTLKIIRGIIC